MVIQSHLLEHMFAVRGYDEEFLRGLDVADADPYPVHTDDAVALLHELHERKAKITFLPDFDMDGIMSGVIGMAGLAELSFYVDLFIPDPKEGYGFNAKTVDRLVATHPGTEAIVTADVGVSCLEGVHRAKELGLAVIVTDHHLPRGMDDGSVALPEADVIVDPMVEATDGFQRQICGACVIYRVLEAYARKYGDIHTVSQIRRLRVFAGIGTVSDGMPMLYGNRQMVRDAISISRLVYADSSHFVIDNLTGHPAYRKAFAGLHQILSQFAEAGKLSDASDIDEEFFGFYLAPTFNSVKRMGADMSRAFGVFFGNDPKGDAEECFRLNGERKVLTEQYTQAIREAAVHPYAPYFYETDAPAGLIGLLAARFLDTSKGPCIVAAKRVDPRTGETVWQGSGRSPAWYPIMSRMGGYRPAHADEFILAGHQGACGFSIHEDDLEDFLAALKADVTDVLSRVDPDMFVWKPDLVISTDGTGDTGIDIVEFLELMDDMRQFRPFGPGFEAPTMALRFDPWAADWSLIGSAKQHLKLVLPYGLVVLCWNQAQLLDEKKAKTEPVTVIGKLSLHDFRGVKTVQFIGDMQ